MKIFHKKEVQTVILRCLVCLNLNLVKSYDVFWLKCLFFHAWKCIISGVKYRSKFWYIRRKPSVMFSKWVFFQNFWWCHEPFNQVKCRWKNENDFWTFYQQKNWFKFVSFLTDQTLCNPHDNYIHVTGNTLRHRDSLHFLWGKHLQCGSGAGPVYFVVLTTPEGSGIFLDLPLGQLWSDFDDFYSIGKLLIK